MAQRRVLMVALDGLSLSVLQDGFAQGRFPNLHRFAEASTELRVRSDGETLEGTVWPTFASGTGPGTHGHYWFQQWIAETSSLVPASDPRLAFDPFWKAALEAGRRVVVFDVPYAPPVGHANERAYIGWGLQDEMAEHVHPAGFRRAVKRRHGRSGVHKDTLLVRTPADRLALAIQLRAAARQRAAVLHDLVRAGRWDLLLFGFGEFHLGGHHLAMPMQLAPGITNDQALRSIIEPLDEAWPAIVAAAGEDCDIVLFALHGMQPRVSFGDEAVAQMLRALDGRPLSEPSSSDSLRRLRDLLPRQLHQALWLRLPASIRLRRMEAAWKRNVDIHRDRVLLLGADCSVALRVNIQGRERFGVVPSAEAPSALARLWEEARRYRTEEGEEAFVELKILEDLFPGQRLGRLPDAAIIYNPRVRRTRKLTRDDGLEIALYREESRNGTHTGEGFAFYHASGTLDVLRSDIDNRDFAPTVLQRLGVAAPGHLEGATFVG